MASILYVIPNSLVRQLADISESNYQLVIDPDPLASAVPDYWRGQDDLLPFFETASQLFRFSAVSLINSHALNT